MRLLEYIEGTIIERQRSATFKRYFIVHLISYLIIFSFLWFLTIVIQSGILAKAYSDNLSNTRWLLQSKEMFKLRGQAEEALGFLIGLLYLWVVIPYMPEPFRGYFQMFFY